MPFRNLPDTKLCHFNKGDILIKAGEQVKHIYFLVKGIVYREIATENGNETILTIKTNKNPVGALVGVLILYRKEQISTGNFIAKTKCTCYEIPKEVFLNYAKERPEVLSEIIHVLLEEHSHIIDLYNTKREGNVSSRLCAFLLDKGQKIGDKIIVSTKWTNMEMAKLFGVHPVTIARIIKVLKDEQLITRTKQGIVLLEREKIKDYAEQRDYVHYRYAQELKG